MASAKPTWKCQHRSAGVVCGQVNVKPKRKCSRCGALKRKRRPPAHAAVLDEMAYEQWVVIFGARCGICGMVPREGQKRLQRDHDHGSGAARGLLCFRCNTALRDYMTLEWMRRAVAYLERAEQPRGSE